MDVRPACAVFWAVVKAGQAGQGNVGFECAERHCKVILSWACFGQLVASELQLRAL